MATKTGWMGFLRGAGVRSLLAALAVSFSVATLDGQENAFRLARAIPDDAFMVVGERHNPERQFLEEYWNEVWIAFQESGVPEDLFDLAVTLTGEESRPELTRIRDRFGKLLSAVDWGAMGGGDMVFAERLQVRMRPSGQPMLVAPQDIVFLFRVGPADARPNFEGMRAILEAGVEEINAAAGTRFAVERATKNAVELASLNLTRTEPDMPELALSVGLHEDVLLITFGGAIRDDVAGLLSGSGKRGSIADSRRFRAAFASLPEAEDGFEYFDAPNLHRGLDQLMGAVFDLVEGELAHSTPGDRIRNANKVDQAVALHEKSNQAYFAGDYAEALRLVEEAYAADPTDPTLMYNQACFLALLGEKERAFPWLENAVEAGFYAPRQMSHDPDLASLRSDFRYKTLVEIAKLRAQEDRLADLRAGRSMLERMLGSLRAIDYAATVIHTERFDVYRDTVTALAEDAASLPIYPVLTGGRPVTDFGRSLPVETVSYSVSGGCNLEALYRFGEETFAEAGGLGERLLAGWQRFQEEQGFDVHKDLLGWIDGEWVSASFEHDGEESWVWMLRVKDDEQAREKLALGLDALPGRITELIAKVPPLAMLSLRTNPTAEEGLEGFHELRFALAPAPIVCGVRDGWLIFGSSGDAVLLTQRTAAGEHPSVLQNEDLMARALLPDGPASSIRFRDHRKDPETVVAILDGVAAAGGMMAAMIPDPRGQEVVLDLAEIVRKLSPVVEEIDFYESTASYQTFDGNAWRSRSVTHYLPPTG